VTTKSLLATVTLILGSTSWAFAAEPPSAPATGPSKETREKMAVVHEQLAACLRSDKPIAECHKEAMKHHEEMGMMGKEGCTKMDMDHTTPGQPGKTEAPK
jgi:hypothetical protein